MRSHCDEQYVGELAVTAGYYQAKAEMMQALIRRHVASPDNYAVAIEMQTFANRDMATELDDMKARHAPKREEAKA